MYDNLAAILGLDELNATVRTLAAEKKELDAVVNAEKERKPLLHAALNEVGHYDRAVNALMAMEEPGGPDYAVLDALIAGVPVADEGRLGEARLEAAAEGPDLDQVGAAVDALRRALADVKDLKGTAAADAHSRAELLQAALCHHDRHADDKACPVCGTQDVLDREWARRAEEQIATPPRGRSRVRRRSRPAGRDARPARPDPRTTSGPGRARRTVAGVGRLSADHRPCGVGGARVLHGADVGGGVRDRGEGGA